MNPTNQNEPNDTLANNDSFNSAPQTPVEAPVEQPAVQPVEATIEPQQPVVETQPVDTVAQPDAITPPAPLAPVAAATVDSSTPGSSTPKNKKLWPIVAIAAGALLLIAGGLLAFFLLTTVSKDDYRAAADQFNKLTSANSSLNSSTSSLNYGASRDTDDEFNTAVKEAEDDLAKVKTENESLGKLKAVRVGEGENLYKTFNDKLGSQLAFQADYITSLKAVRPALVVCKASSSSSTAERTDALKKCAAALGDVKNVPVAEIATYVSSLKDGYATYATNYEKISQLTSPYGAQSAEYKALRDQIYSAQDKVSDAGDTYSDAIKKRQDDLSVKDSADKLATFLTDKQK